MTCTNAACSTNVRFAIPWDSRTTASVAVSGVPCCNIADAQDDVHQSRVATREAFVQELDKGIGATEAYENVACTTDDCFLTKDSARAISCRWKRKEVVPQCWPRDTMLCLVLLKEVQKQEITPEEPVSGYIQVSIYLIVS